MASKFTAARWGAAALVASASLTLAPVSIPEAAAQARCFGFTAADLKNAGFTTADFSGGSPASFTSGGGPVAIIGSPGGDTLSAANASSAVICGKGGADQITGSPGPDQIKGGPGNDTIAGNGDKDLVKGGADNDRLAGDFLFSPIPVLTALQDGELGFVDTVNGGAGLDTCGEQGQDQILNCESLQGGPILPTGG
jgi:Ca2+-binding RTX toxin-like protein